MLQVNDFYFMDCLSGLKQVSDNSIQLIVTSPPYADKRKKTYGGIPSDQYVEWFLPIAKECYRVLKSDGTFIINIKEGCKDGERETYVLELILALRKQGWLWTEEYCWHKRNAYPGKWPNRFRDAWERCLQFNKSKHFKMNQDAVMVPTGEWAEKRLKNLSEKYYSRLEKQTGSGFGTNYSHWVNRPQAYPDNVLYLSTVCDNKAHSAVFPKPLPEFFIKLFTDQKDIVADIFMGSGTTIESAIELNRQFIGFDNDLDAYDACLDRLIKYYEKL